MNDRQVIHDCIRHCVAMDDPDCVRDAAEAMYRNGTHWLIAWRTALACESFGEWLRHRLTHRTETGNCL
jgi:hypothetical protein